MSKLGFVALLALLGALVGAAMDSEDNPKLKRINEWFEGIDKQKVLFALNAGSDKEYTDDAGIKYAADSGSFVDGGQTTSGCGMNHWPFENMFVYHSERWGEQFTYKMPLSLKKDGQFTLILKFSECYFWEPGMKVFDIKVGDKKVLKNVDPFTVAGGKLTPGDMFLDIKITGGKLTIDGQSIKNGVVDGKLELQFAKGRADNPKVNALLLVEGGVENTHKANYDDMKQALVEVQEERAEARAKAEQFFAEDAYDYEERVDGRGPFNKFLQMDYAFEVTVTLILIGFFKVALPKSKK